MGHSRIRDRAFYGSFDDNVNSIIEDGHFPALVRRGTLRGVSTVLIVQEDPAPEDEWSVQLASSGHSVLTARAPADGIERVREGGVDVIILDSFESGGELADFVAALERLPETPPIILVSSSPDSPQISARVGAAAFLPKPCSAAELHAAVARVSPSPDANILEDEPTLPRFQLHREEEGAGS